MITKQKLIETLAREMARDDTWEAYSRDAEIAVEKFWPLILVATKANEEHGIMSASTETKLDMALKALND